MHVHRLDLSLCAALGALVGSCGAESPEIPQREIPRHAATLPTPRGGAFRERHEELCRRARSGPVQLVFLGDSITQGWEREGADVWERYYGERAALNFGISADRTQHLLWRVESGCLDHLQPRLAVVMIGTNNSGANDPRQIADGVEAVVRAVEARLPTARILLLGIFPRGATAADERRRAVLAANELLAELADGERVHYLDVGALFLEPDGSLSREVMPDLLHLSPRGYEVWAEAIEPDVARLLGET